MKVGSRYAQTILISVTLYFFYGLSCFVGLLVLWDLRNDVLPKSVLLHVVLKVYRLQIRVWIVLIKGYFCLKNWSSSSTQSTCQGTFKVGTCRQLLVCWWSKSLWFISLVWWVFASFTLDRSCRCMPGRCLKHWCSSKEFIFRFLMCWGVFALINFFYSFFNQSIYYSYLVCGKIL